MKRKVKMYKPCYECGGSTHKYAEGGEFEPHTMYNPETGEGVPANTMEEHLALKEQGYLHKEEMQQRKAFGGALKKFTKQFYAGGTSMQNKNIDDIANDRKNYFTSYLGNNAKTQIANEEGMMLYDQKMKELNAAGMPMMNWAGNVNYNFGEQALKRNTDAINNIKQ